MKKAAFCFLLMFACGKEEEESIDAELCEHMIMGPSMAATASATAGQGPDVSTEHMRFDVTLGDFEGMKGGYAEYAAGEAGDFIFALSDASVPLSLTTADGTALTIESSGATAECTEVAVQHTVELEVGSARLRLGPTAKTTVSLVIEHGAHEHEE